MKAADGDFIIICAYMPFFDASNRARCMAETVDAISMVETIIENHPRHKFILGGDLNTELVGASPFDAHWNDLLSKFQLTYCDSRFPSNSTTYRHKTLNQEKWSDHFVVSNTLMTNQRLSNFSILGEGDNQSDHLPILSCLRKRPALPFQRKQIHNDRR